MHNKLWKGTLENGGLKLNVSKTKYMECRSPDSSTIHIGPELAFKSEEFRYLGSFMHESVGIDHDVYSQISAAWAKWREVTGMVCDRRIPPRLKGLIYKRIIRSVLLYGVVEMVWLRYLYMATNNQLYQYSHLCTTM